MSSLINSISQPEPERPRVVKQRHCIRCRAWCDNTSPFCGDLCREEYDAIGKRMRQKKRAK